MNLLSIFSRKAKMNKKVVIYVPTTCTELLTNKMRNEVKKGLSKICGGCTELSGTGCYFSEIEKRVISEKTFLISANFDKKENKKIRKFTNEIVNKYKEKMKQECIGIEINGTLYYD